MPVSFFIPFTILGNTINSAPCQNNEFYVGDNTELELSNIDLDQENF